MPESSYKSNLAESNSHSSSQNIADIPKAIEAEKSVLSSLLRNPGNNFILVAEKGITSQTFYHPAHQTIFEVISLLNSQKENFDLIILTQILKDRNLLDSLGGESYLADLYSFSFNDAFLEIHLDLLKEKAILRNLIEQCNHAMTSAYGNVENIEQLLDRTEQAIFDVRNQSESQQEKSVKELLDKVYNNFGLFMKTKGAPQGLLSGYDELDRVTGGFKAGEVCIIAARPSMGKTSFMMNLVEYISVNTKVPTLVFSCEMPAVAIAERLLFARAKFNKYSAVQELTQDKNQAKGLSEKHVRTITKAAEEIKSAPLFIDDTAGISIAELRAKARRKKREHGIGFIAIDYLQLMRSHSKQAAQSREREIAEISAGIKALAKELEVPIVILSQLNRGPESRVKSEPRMSDLRESGSIEQDADIIALLYRAEYYNKGEEQEEHRGEAYLDIAKNRNGETRRLDFTFIAEQMRFVAGKPATE